MPGLPRDLVYVGIGGSVVALDRTTGSERWRTRLKRNQLVMLTTDGERLYASVLGQAYCLDPTTGTVLWNNPLKGLGLGIATMVGPNGESSGWALPAAAAALAKAAAGHG